MAQRLIGKVAVVTGSGGGIGKAVALAMAAEGAKVVVNDIIRAPNNTSEADEVVEEIRKAEGTAIANYASVATIQGGEDIINMATSSFGRIDILVNCAGNFKSMRSAEMTEKDWDSIMDVHLKGHFSCIKAAIPEMMQQKSGRIINISSRSAFLPVDFPMPPPATVGMNLAYTTAKAGILGLTAILSLELKEYGITVNAILPSAITRLFPGPRKNTFGGGEMGGPDFLAPIFVYLATDEAQNITGQLIHACSGDLCIFNRPLQIPGPHMLVSRAGKWTVDELSELLPSLI